MKMEQTIENNQVSQEPSNEIRAKVDTSRKRTVEEQEKHDRIVKIISRTIIYILLTIGALTCVFPFYWMIISSLKTIEEYESFVPTYFPHQITWDAYKLAVGYSEGLFWTTLVNSLVVGFVSTGASVIFTILAAYAFAKIDFKGKNLLFSILLATMMIPGELFTITNYATVKSLGWTSTFTVLIVPFLVSVFYIYLLRQNFKQIPNELYLAAKVDGKSDLEYLIKVMVPLALPSLVSITILKMMGAWNSYIWPRLVANDDAHKLITNGLRSAFTTTEGDTNYPVQMAAVALVSLPLFLVFLFLRKYIMKGVSRSGIKG
jgi:multiple sugar transport system permease protein